MIKIIMMMIKIDHKIDHLHDQCDHDDHIDHDDVGDKDDDLKTRADSHVMVSLSHSLIRPFYF